MDTKNKSGKVGMPISQHKAPSHKPKAKHTLLRHWHLLRKLPRFPRRKGIDELLEYLKNENFDITRRTLERDLVSLAEVFPIENDGAKPAGWSWLENATALSLPSITATEALTFKLVKQHLTDLMPVSVLAHLEPFFEQAERELKSLNKSPLQEWPDKISSVPSSQPLLPPVIDATVQQVVSEALLNNQQLKISYQSREQIAPAVRTVNPLGMVSRGGLVYLIAAAADDLDTIRLRLMHRIHSAEILNVPAQRPANFELKTFIDSGHLGFGQGKMLTLKVAFMAETAMHLHDTRLSLDQQIESYDPGRVLVTATLADTQQLTWWLLGFGDKIEVIEPIELRQKIADIALGMVKHYGNKS